MRLNPKQISSIQTAVASVTSDVIAIRLFGSRLNDNARGGDIDLMVDLKNPVEHPALLCARIATQISRSINGRKVDVLLRAPNLQQTAIHRIAQQEGVFL